MNLYKIKASERVNMKWFMLGCGIWLAASSFGNVRAQEVAPGKAGSKNNLGSTMTLEELKNGGKPPVPVEQQPVKTRLLTSAAEPIPALRYRFWPAAQELKGGDAKVHFFRMAVSFNSGQRSDEMRKYNLKWEELRDAGQEVPVQEIRKLFEPYRLHFEELETMSLCDRQTLDMQIRDLRGADVYSVTLEEIQVARDLARLLRWRMVEQAAAGDWDRFARTARTGYRLAALVASGDTLIHNLVGIAITNLITDEVQRAGEYKGSPNFYWALASLPRPMFNLTTSLELETSIVERVFPFLVECRKGPLPESVIQKHWETMQKTLRDIDVGFSVSAGVVGALNVETAKANLRQRGWKEENFKGYPAMQLVLIDLDDTMRETGDMAMKYFLLPDSVGQQLRVRENEAFEKWLKENKSLAGHLANMLFPALISADRAARRVEHVINAAMNREALRMHVAKHGALPESMAALDPVPALPNPFTNRPFELSVKPTGDNKRVEVSLLGEVPGFTAEQVTWIYPFLIELNQKP